MSTSYTKEQLAALLAPWKQEHLLNFWDELSDSEKDILGGQITAVNWEQVTKWLANVLGDNAEAESVPFEKLIPAPYVALEAANADEQEFQSKARAAGEELLRAGKVAGFTVAGGQGTRLGFDGPKGTYCFSALRNASLFQCFAEAIICNQKKYGAVIPWYIMTSPANHADTVAFFEANGYFGLDQANVRFFTQGTLPGFSTDGKVLMESKYQLALFANGHGGTLAALRESGTLDDMEARGVEYLAYWQVDNPMVSVCDPLFIGMHALTGSEMSSRALIKRDAMEKLGHFTLLDGRLVIIEYSDMPDNLLQKRDADGRLTFRAGSPAIHVLSRKFIQRLTAGGTLNLQPHRATKKISYVAEDGSIVKPAAPNGIKLEFFIFDALPLAANPLILEADREEQFAAIKNAEGQDSPESCRAAMAARTAKWLKAAGVDVPAGAVVEIPLSLAVCAEDAAALVKAGYLPAKFTSDAKFAL
jgi:UDP-N-acetylglucosamine/UDP-N-acetylgalactosamine diphosphorylase